jgi:hypothetical protein
VQAPPKRKKGTKKAAPGVKVKAFPRMTEVHPGCPSGASNIEPNSSTIEESEIVDDPTQIQTDWPDNDGSGAAKRQKTKNERGLKATRVESSEKYTVDGKPVLRSHPLNSKCTKVL